MKKLVFALCIFLCICSKSQTQTDWGPVIENPHPGSDHMYITTEDTANIYVIKKDYGFKAKEIWYIEAINKQRKSLVFSRYLVTPFTADKKITEWNAIINLGSNLYLFSSYHDKLTGQFSAYATPINKTSGINGESILIYSTNTSAGNPYFQYTVSPDGNKLLLSCSPLELKDNELKVIDENLNSTWSGFLTARDVSQRLDAYQVMMDNAMNLVVFTGNYKANGIVLNPTLILYATSRQQVKTITIETPQQFNIYNQTMRFYGNNQLYFAGLLRINTSRVEITGGIISAHIDLDKQKIISTLTNIFNDQQLEELTGINRGWKNEYGLYFYGLYFIKNVFFRPNGTVSLLTEQGYARATYFPGNNPYYYYYMPYNYYNMGINGQPVMETQRNLILAINLTEQGNINWLKMIPKYQSYAVKEYLSFTAGYDNDKLYLIYNDNKDNVFKSNAFSPKCMQNPKRSIAVVTTIDNNGNTKTKPFYWSKTGSGMAIKPALCTLLQSNKVLLFFEKDTRFSLGEFTLH
jgi:hypothetical protein